jgi:ATP-dependent RNA helicase DbpA
MIRILLDLSFKPAPKTESMQLFIGGLMPSCQAESGAVRTLSLMETKSFQELPLKKELLLVLEELKLQSMSSIQQAAIPAILGGADLVGLSQTGSGKTISFALPILNKIELMDQSVQALVLSPTRELANQLSKEFRKLGRKLEGLKAVVLSGGLPSREQAMALENGCHVAVGTPGRVLDLLKKRKLNLDGLKVLVLDEADKMLEMGFQDEMNEIFGFVPKKRQTLMFSATFPEGVLGLSQNLQINPQKIEVQEDESLALDEYLFDFSEGQKIQVLMRVLKTFPAKACLIFCNQKKTVDEIVVSLKEQKAAAEALHGDLEQRQRDQVTALFRNGSLRILVATDVAARGLDIENLDLVVNFDLPLSPDAYVHRIGRVGRMGQERGIAVTLARPQDELKIFTIEKFTQRKMQRPALGFKNQHGLSDNESQARMQTLSISGGKKDRLRPGDILGALTKDLGLEPSSIGKIEIFDKFSYVAIASEHFQNTFDRLKDGRIKGQKFQVRKK